MAEFLTARGTSHHLENIIIDAKNQLILVSPFLQLSKTLFERLKDTSAKGVEMIILFGKTDLKPTEKDTLGELRGLKLYFHENLHAKCYFNESRMVITSMNMYQFSENNNREMGVLIDAESDNELYEKAKSEVLSILKHSEIINLQKEKKNFPALGNGMMYEKNRSIRITQPPAMGHCLRCQDRILYDPNKPYCRNCYSSWAEYANVDYEEEFCHCCGELHVTSMARPLCIECFENFPFM